MLNAKAPTSCPPSPSPLSLLISQTTSQISSTTPIPPSALTLPLEILHNLQFQHSWRDLCLHQISPSRGLRDIPTSLLASPHGGHDDPSYSGDQTPFVERGGNSTPTAITSSAEPIYILSGIPPRPAYTHPDLQTLLLKHSLAAEKDLPQQREFVFPLSLGDKDVELQMLARVFDSLPMRNVLRIGGGKRGHAVNERDGLDAARDSASISDENLGRDADMFRHSNRSQSREQGQLSSTASTIVPEGLGTQHTPTPSSYDPATTTCTKNEPQTARKVVENASAINPQTSDTPSATLPPDTHPKPSPAVISSLNLTQVPSLDSPNTSLQTQFQWQRQPQHPAKASSSKKSDGQEWQDPKRLLLALKAHDGFGGDGTVAYYVCLEGEVKPRQNG